MSLDMADDPGGTNTARDEAEMGTDEGVASSVFSPHENQVKDVDGNHEANVGPSKNKDGKGKGKEKAEVAPREDVVKHHDVPQLEPIDEALADVDNGPEFEPLPELMKKMLWQFDRTLGYQEFEAFCDEITTKYRSSEKDSRQAFARTFTWSRKKVPTALEMELARCSHGGYLPRFALKFATTNECPQMVKWKDSSKEAYDVIDGRPQPKGRAGPQKMTYTPAKPKSTASPSAKVGTAAINEVAKKLLKAAPPVAGPAKAGTKFGSKATKNAGKKGTEVGTNKRKRPSFEEIMADSEDELGEEDGHDDVTPQAKRTSRPAPKKKVTFPEEMIEGDEV